LGTDTLQPIDAQLKLEVQSNMRIVLARAQIKNCQLYQPLSTAQRRNARQSTRPRIVCDSAGPAALKWSLDTITTSTGGPTGWGMHTNVDTSSARFQTTPCYSAYIMGDRLFPAPAGALPFVLDGWVNISNPGPQGFTLQLVMPSLDDGIINPPAFFNATDVNSILAGNAWTVVWLAVES
jgi:hypothetical protein